jgi:hypothetical protein
VVKRIWLSYASQVCRKCRESALGRYTGGYTEISPNLATAAMSPSATRQRRSRLSAFSAGRVPTSGEAGDCVQLAARPSLRPASIPRLASYLRIEERELEAGGPN